MVPDFRPWPSGCSDCRRRWVPGDGISTAASGGSSFAVPSPPFRHPHLLASRPRLGGSPDLRSAAPDFWRRVPSSACPPSPSHHLRSATPTFWRRVLGSAAPSPPVGSTSRRRVLGSAAPRPPVGSASGRRVLGSAGTPPPPHHLRTAGLTSRRRVLGSAAPRPLLRRPHVSASRSGFGGSRTPAPRAPRPRRRFPGSVIPRVAIGGRSKPILKHAVPGRLGRAARAAARDASGPQPSKPAARNEFQPLGGAGNSGPLRLG